MQVHDRLAAGSAIIDANVETIWVALRQQELSHLGQQFKHGRLLFCSEYE